MMLILLFRFSAGECIGHHDLLLAKVGHSKLLAAALLTKVIVRRVDRQAIQPWFKDLGRPQLIEGKIKPQENLSCDILDTFRTGDQTVDRPQNPFPVRQYDFVERRTIALLRSEEHTSE